MRKIEKKLIDIFINIREKIFNYSKRISIRKKLKNKISKKAVKVSYKSFWKKYYKHYNSIPHTFYYDKTGIKSHLFIPDDFWYIDVDKKLNKWRELTFLEDKNLYSQLMPDIKQPIFVAKKIRGVWQKDGKIISFEKLMPFFIKYKELIVKKTIDSCGGSGVYFYESNQFYDIDKLGDNLIVQEVLKQSQELCKLSNTSINTIRVLTLLKDNKVVPLSTVVRFGINGSRVDNVSSGGCSCGIHENGRLKEVGFDSNFNKIDRNPNNGETFSNIVIPRYKDIINLACKEHEKLLLSKIISWDFTIDQNNNIVLIEANLTYGELDFHQLNNGPLFKSEKELVDFLKYVKSV